MQCKVYDCRKYNELNIVTVEMDDSLNSAAHVKQNFDIYIYIKRPKFKNSFLGVRYENHLFERLAKRLMIAKPLMVSTIKNETALSTGVELNRIRE